MKGESKDKLCLVSSHTGVDPPDAVRLVPVHVGVLLRRLQRVVGRLEGQEEEERAGIVLQAVDQRLGLLLVQGLLGVYVGCAW